MTNLRELRWQDPRTQTYLGSPSLVRLPDGALLASHDYFGPGCPRNHEGEEHLTSIYRSEDGGESWQHLTHIANAFWSTLFVHEGAVYLLGCSQQYGSIVIRRSEDGGFTWTHPQEAESGWLFPGGYYHEPPNYHCAPTPVLVHEGRIYRAFEDCAPCVWPQGFKSCVISAPTDSDLLQAASWTMSNKLAFAPQWIPVDWEKPGGPGWLEGNLVASAQGELWNILRLQSAPMVNKAARVRVTEEGQCVSFDPGEGFLDFPGGMSKFTLRQDPVTGQYLALSNPVTQPGAVSQRNILALCVSTDLCQWTVRVHLLEDDSGLSPEDSCRLTGFQYADWQFDEEDLICLVRVAWDGAHNFHDANRIMFLRVENFRDLL